MNKKYTGPVVGIMFGDNDFFITIQAFLEGLKNDSYNKFKVTPDNVAELFNRSAAGLYWLHQNRLDYNTDWDAAKYLQIEKKYVCIGMEEINAYLESRNHDCNSEFMWIDENGNIDFC